MPPGERRTRTWSTPASEIWGEIQGSPLVGDPFDSIAEHADAPAGYAEGGHADGGPVVPAPEGEEPRDTSHKLRERHPRRPEEGLPVPLPDSGVEPRRSTPARRGEVVDVERIRCQ